MIRSVWFKLLVSIALLGWLLARTPLTALLYEFSRLDAGTLILGAALSLLAWLLSAARWWRIAPEFRLSDVVRMTFIALFYGTVLPGQVAGDVVKAYRLSASQQYGGHAAAATLVDRGVAMLALFLIGAIAAVRLAQAPTGLRIALWIGYVGLLCGGGLLAVPKVRDHLVALTQTNGSGRLARALEFLQRLAHALHDALRRPGRIAVAFMLALAYHAICIAIHMLLGHALGLDPGVAVWCLVYASVSVLMLLPVSVAGIGLREGGYVGLLALFGVNRETALALSFTFLGYALFGALLGLTAEIAAPRNERANPQ